MAGPMAYWAPGKRPTTACAMMWAAECRSTDRPVSLSAVMISMEAQSGSGADRSRNSPSTRTATAASARRRPMARAAVAPVAPASSCSADPSGRVMVMGIGSLRRVPGPG